MLKSLCTYTPLIVLLLLFTGTTQSQTNNPGPYCVGTYSNVPCSGPGPSNAPGNTSNDFIDSLYTLGANLNLNTVSSGCNGLPNNYIYYCNQNLVCNAGQSIQLNLKSGHTYSQAFYLFIDWNQNFQFDLPGELIGFTSSIIAPSTWTNIVFSIPINALNGIYRMRIRSLWTNFSATATPCGSYQWGETEDYNIVIGSTPPTAPTSATASSNYSICSGQNATFQLQYSGATPGNFSWSGPAGFSNSLQNFSLSAVSPSYNGYFHCSMGTSTCPLLASTYLWVRLTPTLQATASPSVFCPGTINYIQLSASGFSTVYWLPVGMSNTLISITPSISTVFTVVAQPDYGCSSSQTVGVTVLSNFTVQISASSTLICAGETINLQASGAEFYSWSFAQGGPSVMYQAYTSTVVSVIGSGSLCNASASISISVDNCESVEENGETEFQLFYTNPFSDDLILNCTVPVEIDIYTLEGKKLLSLSSNTHFFIPTLNYPVGIYLVRAFNRQNYVTIKVIKD